MSGRPIEHGESALGERTPEYKTWRAMNSRCFNKTNKDYEKYGGGGITVDPRWRGRYGYEAFLKDMGRKPTLEHTLERYLIGLIRFGLIVAELPQVLDRALAGFLALGKLREFVVMVAVADRALQLGDSSRRLGLGLQCVAIRRHFGQRVSILVALAGQGL